MLSLDRQNQWRERYRAEHPGWRPATEVFADHVRARLRPEARLLDIGCGRGGLVEQLDHPLRRTFGIDPDLVSLREHRLPDLPRAAATGDRLPFRGGSFDLIAAAWLLEHLADPAATLTAVARALRPGGAFVFITPNARHPLAWANRLAGRLGRLQGRLVDLIYGRAASDTFPTVYRANSPQAVARLAAAAGLRVEVIDLIADPSYAAFGAATYRAMGALDARLPADRRIHIVGVLAHDQT